MKSNRYTSFGIFLKNSRKKASLTQKELADTADIPSSSISAIEIGRILPSTKTMEKLATALDVSIEDLKEEKEKAENHVKVGMVSQSVARKKGKNWADMSEEEQKYYSRSEYEELLNVHYEDEVPESFYPVEDTTEKNRIKLQVTLLEKFNQLNDINKRQLIEFAKILLDNQK